MKNILFLLTTLLFGAFNILYAQNSKTAFQVNNSNYLYQGLENSISIVSTQKFDSISIENANNTSNLKKFNANNIRINVIPTTNKSVTISLFSKTKMISQQVYKVERLTAKPKASIAGKYGANVVLEKAQLLSTTGLGVKLYDFNYDVKFDLLSYSLRADFGNKEINPFEVKGNKFNEQVRQMFQLVSSGSVLIFDDIIVRYPDGLVQKIDPLTIKIK
jgi:hypothetical protein